MRRAIFTLVLISSFAIGKAQGLNGVYTAYEPIGLHVDTLGKLDFYMRDRFPNETWLYEVNVTIKGSHITVTKSPVTIDSCGKKNYSVSDGGFLTYKGKIKKFSGVYVAQVRLIEHDYIGFSLFQPPTITNSDSNNVAFKLIAEPKRSAAEFRNTHDVTVGFHGSEVFLPRGTLQQNYVLKLNHDGIWINNMHFRRQ